MASVASQWSVRADCAVGMFGDLVGLHKDPDRADEVHEQTTRWREVRQYMSESVLAAG